MPQICKAPQPDGTIFEYDCTKRICSHPVTGFWGYCDPDPQDAPRAVGFAMAINPEVIQPNDESTGVNASFDSLEHALATQTKEVMEIILGFPIEKGFEMDRRLKADSYLLAEFNESPDKILIREVGLKLPKGFYCHFADDNNTVSPPEGNGSSFKSWSRIEIKTSSDQSVGSFFFSVICANLK
jgi:hypothetical protein